MCRTQPLRAGLDCCGTKTVCIPSIKVCFYCLGVAASERGDFKTARDYFELKLKELKVTGNKDLEGATKMNIGFVYLSFGDIKKAIEFLEHGLSIAKAVRNKTLFNKHLHRCFKKVIFLTRRKPVIRHPRASSSERVVNTTQNLT